MNPQDNILLMAKYNVWATHRLVASLDVVSDEHFYQDVALYFKSIFGTLNHMLLGEHYLWYSRFAGHDSPKVALDHIVHEHRKDLLNALESKSKNWIHFINQLDVALLQGDLSYQRVSGQSITLPYAATLIHVFNHSTHHRGQITAAMTALGYICPELDLVYMLIEQNS